MALSPISSFHPDSESPLLGLRNDPTPKERRHIWTLMSQSWRETLTAEQFVEQSDHMFTTAPLARNGGLTIWFLTDTTRPPDGRPVFCSCETYRKRALVSSDPGTVSEKIIHGIASVFTEPRYRRRGYAARMMTDLAVALKTWQPDCDVAGSVLYSDIGKGFYAGFGWHPLANNWHVEICAYGDASSLPEIEEIAVGLTVKRLCEDDLAQLCLDDEAMVRKAMAASKGGEIKSRVCVIPDLNHMRWHHSKEEFTAANFGAGRVPTFKGVLVGDKAEGNRIWAIWTHRWYRRPGPLDGAGTRNTLYVLRLVVEGGIKDGDDGGDGGKGYHGTQQQVEQMKALVDAMRFEAMAWELDLVKIWDPSPLVMNLLSRTGVSPNVWQREKEEIASLLWYGPGNVDEGEVEWVGNEKYAWC
ncbi:hypothetical protein B0T17DRAFT_487925 [Bombardia bombarda]|uniref:LYC1 C-terminal domain-containing protein n=1 Tax=Bombardia bombarda TaxID=252184 RepID=A0AA39X9X1_9PEZI|nr:hypothetical protein B0T17DRAFT_487925 [Bombardia bombarda]